MVSVLKTSMLNMTCTTDDSEFKALDRMKVVGIRSCQSKIYCGNTKAEYTPH
jgi:hypothetical protein